MFKKLKSVFRALVTKDIIGIDPIDVNSLNDVSIRDATATQKGAVLLSTDTMTIGGVGNTCVTPPNLKAKLGDKTPNLLAVGKGNAQALDWWSLYSSDSSVTIDTDITNKRFNIRTTPVVKANFKAYYSASTGNIIPAAANYILVPNTVSYDLTQSFTASTGIFKAPSTDYYKFGACVQCLSISFNLLNNPRIKLYAQSPTELARIEDRVFNVILSLGAVYTSIGETAPMKLNKDDTVQLRLNFENLTGNYGIAGGALNSLSTSYIYGYQL